MIVIANKEHTDLEKKYQQLHRQNGTLQSQVQEKEEKLNKLRTGNILTKNHDYFDCLLIKEKKIRNAIDLYHLYSLDNFEPKKKKFLCYKYRKTIK